MRSSAQRVLEPVVSVVHARLFVAGAAASLLFQFVAPFAAAAPLPAGVQPPQPPQPPAAPDMVGPRLPADPDAPSDPAVDGAVPDPEPPPAGDDPPAVPAAPHGEPPPGPDPASPPPGGASLVAGAEPSLTLAERAAALLGAVLDPDAPQDRVPVGGGAADLAQSLSRAVFSAPVAGSIPYVVQAQVYHDVSLVFPPGWRVVDFLLGDPDRWAVAARQNFVFVKPGEPGSRTNLTVVFATGDLLQIDMQEITGLAGVRRVGRVYVGPEDWLVDRIFSLLPPAVRERVATSPATVHQLLADPVTVVGLYGGTGALPSPFGSLAQAPDPAAAVPAPSPSMRSPAAIAPLEPPEPVRAHPGARRDAPSAASGSDAWVDADLPRFVAGTDLAGLDEQLRAAYDRVEQARRAAGDRIAAAQLGIEADLEALREQYPERIQFSYVLEPYLDPYTEPFWHFGFWHDSERTFVRLLAPDPAFRDEESGDPVASERLDDYLYRLDRVVDYGSVAVLSPDDGRLVRLYFRRRRELEGP